MKSKQRNIIINLDTRICYNPYCSRIAKVHTANEFLCEECFKGLNILILETKEGVA